MDKIRNEEITKEFEIFPIQEERKKLKIQWLEYLQKMSPGSVLK
jgi:hypothetical protein